MAVPSFLLVTLNLIQRALIDNKRILVDIPQIEARIVDHINLLHDLRPIRRIIRRRLLTHLLQLDIMIRMPRRRKPLQHARLSTEQAPGTHAQQRPLPDGIILLHLAERLDERDGLFGLLNFALADDGVGVRAAGDDHDVDVAQGFVGVLVVEVGGDGVALGGLDGFAGGGGEAGEGFLAVLVGGGLQGLEGPGVFEEVDAVAGGLGVSWAFGVRE